MVNQRNAFMIRIYDSLNVFMKKDRNWEANAFDNKKWQDSMQKGMKILKQSAISRANNIWMVRNGQAVDENIS